MRIDMLLAGAVSAFAQAGRGDRRVPPFSGLIQSAALFAASSLSTGPFGGFFLACPRVKASIRGDFRAIALRSCCRTDRARNGAIEMDEIAHCRALVARMSQIGKNVTRAGMEKGSDCGSRVVGARPDFGALTKTR